MLSEHRANGRVKAGTEGGGVEDEVLTIRPHCHSYGACDNLLSLVRWGARRVVGCQVTGRRLDVPADRPMERGFLWSLCPVWVGPWSFKVIHPRGAV